MLESVVADLVLDELTEEEGEHLLVVRCDSEVFPTTTDQRTVLDVTPDATHLNPRSSCFLIELFCAETKLPTVTWIARSISSLLT